MDKTVELFDISDYLKDQPLQCNQNKKGIGKFEDELNSQFVL